MVNEMTQAAASQYYPPSAVALGHVGLGQWDDAFVWLDRAIDLRDPVVMPVLSFPFLDPIRNDGRYHQLLRKMNLDRDHEGPCEGE
jgi:hypothetical protein